MYKELSPSIFLDKMTKMTTIKQFQEEIISNYVRVIINNTTQGVTTEGLENLNKTDSYLYISNHRDILLDPAILQVILFDNGFETTEIAIGDNLLIYPWITELVKLNRTFIVNRNIPVKQMFSSYSRLSNYIRYTLTKKKNSIWIAQREGRSKDGNDRTQISLLKMLNMSGSKSLLQNFKELKIVPVSISYEYDPCDYLKSFEFLMKTKNSDYQKTKEDDLNHMMRGLQGHKGHIHYSFGKPIIDELKALENISVKNDKLVSIAELIDAQIHINYNLWTSNYIAWEILNNNKEYANKYSCDEKTAFIEYINEHITRCNLDNPEDIEIVRNFILEMYANPVVNKRQYTITD
jgi:1-acyl-sn-glycerol-3-phosphate acyltransferase